MNLACRCILACDLRGWRIWYGQFCAISQANKLMKRYFRFLGPIIVTSIFILAIYLLYHKLKAYSIAQIRSSIEQISYSRIGLSLVLMVINYLILVGYDWLALKAIRKNLPISKVGLVSFVGQAVSYNFGALLGGTSVRYRFYSAWGFSITEIVRLVLMLAVTFWVGALGLCGVIFLLAPPLIPDELLHNMPIKDVRFLGAILTLIACSYLALCFAVRKPIRIFGKEFVFPGPRIAIAQCIVAGVDIVAAAACMYVLLPGNIQVSFIDFLPSYLMAQVAVVLTHIPGGVGIFELVILELTHTANTQAVFAAVLLFRLIYYIIPLLAAAVLLGIYEACQRRDLLRDAGRWLSVLSHSISAYLTFVAGLILLVSATFPSMPENIKLLLEYLPKYVLGLGHLVCALSGTSLLFIAYGLERRQSLAFKWAVSLMALGMGGALLKGLSWEVALMVGIILLSVCLARRRFYRRSFFLDEALAVNWLAVAILVIVLVFALGWFIYHPAWDHASSWGFERPFNASRTLRAYAAIIILLFLGLSSRLWAVFRRHQNKN